MLRAPLETHHKVPRSKLRGIHEFSNKEVFQFPISYINSMDMGRIAFGFGAHTTVGNECKAAGITKALITTTGLKGTGIVDEIKGILNYHGVATEVYDKVTSNPKDWQVMEAYQVFKDAGCDGVVSVGGGSSHDCGKGVRAVAANGGRDVCDMAALMNPPWMFERLKYKSVSIPQITVNTTSGTGAETTGVAAIQNTRARSKQLLILNGLCATIALNDPVLIRLQPRHIAAWTGFDAFCHAFETYVGKVPSKQAFALSALALQLLSENLREFVYNRMNHVACENVAWASSLGGTALSLGGGVGIVHVVGHGLSAVKDTHHGLANAVVTLPLERYNQPICHAKFARMVQIMGVDTRHMSEVEASDRWFVEVERLIKDLDIEAGNLNRQFGLTKEDCAHIIRVQGSNDICMGGNPIEYNYEEQVKVLESIL
jgi:methanol:N,N-dimethyl-4-nitrosoaniline oxidoreductase